eukprot:1811660-Rhodomonas_salina.2
MPYDAMGCLVLRWRMVLRACYAMTSTDLAYGATRACLSSVSTASQSPSAPPYQDGEPKSNTLNCVGRTNCTEEVDFSIVSSARVRPQSLSYKAALRIVSPVLIPCRGTTRGGGSGLFASSFTPGWAPQRRDSRRWVRAERKQTQAVKHHDGKSLNLKPEQAARLGKKPGSGCAQPRVRDHGSIRLRRFELRQLTNSHGVRQPQASVTQPEPRSQAASVTGSLSDESACQSPQPSQVDSESRSRYPGHAGTVTVTPACQSPSATATPPLPLAVWQSESQ